MAFIPVANVCQIGLQFILAGRPASCVLHAEHSGAFTVVSMSNLATAIIDAIYDEFGGPTLPATTNLSLVNLRMTDLTTSSSPAIDVIHGTTADLPYVGGYGTAEQGAQVASVVTWQTVKRGRSYRGRSFWPAVPQDKLVDANNITSAWATVMGNMWSVIHNAINGADGGSWTHVVVSRQIDKVVLTEGVATEIASIRMNSRLGTQRRRVL